MSMGSQFLGLVAEPTKMLWRESENEFNSRQAITRKANLVPVHKMAPERLTGR